MYRTFPGYHHHFLKARRVHIPDLFRVLRNVSGSTLPMSAVSTSISLAHDTLGSATSEIVSAFAMDESRARRIDVGSVFAAFWREGRVHLDLPWMTELYLDRGWYFRRAPVSPRFWATRLRAIRKLRFYLVHSDRKYGLWRLFRGREEGCRVPA